MAAGGFSYNNVSMLEFGVYLKSGMQRPMLPTIRERLLEVPGKDGLYSFKPDYGQREFTLDCLLKATSRADALSKIDSIAAVLYTGGAKPLMFDDQDDRYWLATLSGDPRATLDMMSGEFEIKFRCADPFAYSVTETENVYTIDADPQTFAEEVSGSYPVRPEIILAPDGAWNGIVSVANFQTGQEFVWEGEFENAFLLVDCEHFVVKVNSTASMSGMSGAFPYLAPNQINYLLVTGMLGTMKVTYRARFL